MLKGYKTYIAAGLTSLTALAGYLTGDFSLAVAVQMAVTAVLSSTLRSGMNTAAEKAVAGK